MEFSTTTRGNKALVYKGYEYTRFRSNKKGVWSWRCRLAQRSKCPALLKMKGETIIGSEPIHSHDSDPSKAQAKLLTAKMKNEMKKKGATAPDVLKTVLDGVNPRILDRLPTHSMLSQHLQRVRRQENGGAYPENPEGAAFKIPDKYANLILHDTGEDSQSDRILAIGDPQMVEQLCQYKIFGDGCYDSSPKMHFELFTFHAKIGSAHPPCIYFLLARKDHSSYAKMFEILRELCPKLQPGEIVIDLDIRCFAAASDAFPTAFIRGSYFHLHQNILKAIKSVGLQTEYDSLGDVRLTLNSLPALAFVPPDEVNTQFHELVVTFPAEDKRYLDVINHFVTNFLLCDKDATDLYSEPPEFAMENWNLYDAAVNFSDKSSNCCQHIHNALNSTFHTTRRQHVWYLFDSLRNDIKKQLVLLNKSTDMGRFRSDKCEQLVRSVGDIVREYENEVDKLSYLRNLANLQ